VRQTARDKSRAMEIIERLKQLDEQHRLAIREVIRMLNR
jgi:phosphate uptake regulator